MKSNSCISCGGKEFTVHGQSELFTERAGDKAFIQEAYSVLQCEHCGLYYKDNFLDADSFVSYYNSFDFKTWGLASEFPCEDIIEDFLSGKNSLKILDYGCSEGRFISKFTNSHSCYGYDIDLRAMKAAEAKGIQILQSNELAGCKSYFDAIILSDVFEHSTAPTQLISELLLLLNPNGTLIISTGNADSKAAKYDLANFWYFKTIQHVCMLGEKYIKYLEDKFQLMAIKKVYSSHYKSTWSTHMFYSLRFNIYKFVNSYKGSFVLSLLSRLPYIGKITRWSKLPYHPYSKDHVVLFLGFKNASGGNTK